MLLILMLINIILFCVGGYTVIHQQLPPLNKGIKIITSIVSIFVFISYAYYLSLIFKINILFLAGLFSLLNIVLISTCRSAYKNIFIIKKSHEVNNRDILFPLFMILLLTAGFCIYAKRWGGDDAIAIWNMHAKFLLDAGTWKILFKNGMPWAHGDYPLMLPSLIAFFWRSANSITPFIPVIIAYFPLIFIPLVIYFALYQPKNNWLAWLAIAIFVLSNKFISIACLQGADTLLSLLVLLSFILYDSLRPSSKNILYLLGFLTASATWAKNEGLLFFAVFTLVFIVSNYRNKAYLKNYFIGAIIPLLVILSFKLSYSPQNDLVGTAKNTAVIFHKLSDYTRYIAIARFMAASLYYSYIDAVILLFVCLVVNPSFFCSRLFIIVVIMIAGYFMIYIITPYDLHWHLATSADRLLQQFYPALIYGILFSIQKWNNNRQAPVI